MTLQAGQRLQDIEPSQASCSTKQVQGFNGTLPTCSAQRKHSKQPLQAYETFPGWPTSARLSLYRLSVPRRARKESTVRCSPAQPQRNQSKKPSQAGPMHCHNLASLLRRCHFCSCASRDTACFPCPMGAAHALQSICPCSTHHANCRYAAPCLPGKFDRLHVCVRVCVCVSATAARMLCALAGQRGQARRSACPCADRAI